MDLDATAALDLLTSALVPVWGNTVATTTEPESAPLVLAGVLLSLVAIYLASKIGRELSNSIGLPPVLGELVGGVVVGISALHLLVFPEGGGDSANSGICAFSPNYCGIGS